MNSYNTTNGAILLETGNGTVSNTASAPAGTWVTGQWNHVALVVDRAAGTAEIYLNRRKVTTDNTITTDFANNALLKIGRGDLGGARDAFAKAIERVPVHGMARVALAGSGVDAAVNAPGFETSGSVDVALCHGARLVLSGRIADAAAMIDGAFANTSGGSAGWHLPVEPLLRVFDNPSLWTAPLTRLAAAAA